MELRHLLYFVAVAEELHFTRAAARVHIAQPALSQQIRQLERELGVELLVRTKRSVRLTDAGEVFLQHARDLLARAETARRAAQRASRGEIGTLTVGFVASVAGTLLPTVVRAYRARHPDVEVVLHELHTHEQLDALVDGRIEVGLVHSNVVSPQLDTVRLRRESFDAVLPAGHWLAARRSLRLRDLANEPWIIAPRDGTGHTSVLLAAAAKEGFVPRIAYETSEARLTLVACGLGVGLRAASSSHLETPHVVYRPLTRPKVSVDLVAAWRESHRSPLVTAFLETARAEARVELGGLSDHYRDAIS